MKTSLAITIIVASVLPFAGGCGDDDHSPGVPNPAAQFCEEQGGTTSGPEPMCTLSDGTVVDAWDYYRSKAESNPGVPNPAAVFCEERGGSTSGPEPMCTLPDRSVVDAWEYFRSEGPLSGLRSG